MSCAKGVCDHCQKGIQTNYVRNALGFPLRCKVCLIDRSGPPPPPPPADKILIDFEDYQLLPLSDSDTNLIQPTNCVDPPCIEDWSGGAPGPAYLRKFFTNDSTDDETVTNAQAYQGTQSWFFSNVYGSPGDGSPFTPPLKAEWQSTDETDFYGKIPGSTYTASFWFRSEAATDDGSTVKMYNGTYGGDDRTGFNINIQNATGGVRVYTFTWDGATFPEVDLATGLAFQTWHKVEVTIQYSADGDPDNDIYTYKVNDGAGQVVNSWVNIWRKFNGFNLEYGTRIAFAGDSNLSGFYIDDICYEIDTGGDLAARVAVVRDVSKPKHLTTDVELPPLE